MAKFSVIIPTFQRPEKIVRAVKSVLNQTYKDFEIIVVDDGSTFSATAKAVIGLQRPGSNLIYIRQVRHQRLIARNLGMRSARHEWIVWMDDDDELFPTYLEEFNKAIEANPEYSVLNCSVQFYKVIEGTEKKLRIMKPIQLDNIDLLEEEPLKRREFRSGCITTGQFIFNKRCLNIVGYLPHTHLYGDFAIMSGIPGYGWLDPQPPRFPEKRVQVLGNPWGDDFYLFYKLTRKYGVFPIETILYKKNCR